MNGVTDAQQRLSLRCRLVAPHNGPAPLSTRAEYHRHATKPLMPARSLDREDFHNPSEEDMTRKLMTLFAAAAVLSGIAMTTTVFAETGTSSSRPERPHAMMGDHGGMMNMLGQMSPDQMRQMTAMMDTCNNMMGSKSSDASNRSGLDFQSGQNFGTGPYDGRDWDAARRNIMTNGS